MSVYLSVCLSGHMCVLTGVRASGVCLSLYDFKVAYVCADRCVRVRVVSVCLFMSLRSHMCVLTGVRG